MKEKFEYEGTVTGEYKSGFYVTYAGQEYEAVYLGVGRFILFSDYPNEHFTFPVKGGQYILQTDLRDELLTCASETRMIGIVKGNYETVMIREIFEEGIMISTYNPRLAFELSLKPVKELGFTGIVDRDVLVDYYEEHDYLWNPKLGIYATFCQGAKTNNENTWFLDRDRFVQICTVDNPYLKED